MLTAQNSTPCRPEPIIRFKALPPPPPTPITLMRAPPPASDVREAADWMIR